MQSKSKVDPAFSYTSRHSLVGGKRRILGLKLGARLWRAVAYPGILFGEGGSRNSVEDRGQRERESGGGSPLVRGSGGSCNLVQEISFRIIKFS